MPLRVALKRAATNVTSADDQRNGSERNSEILIQPKIVQLRSKADASTRSFEAIFNCLNTCFLRIDAGSIIIEANPIALNWLRSFQATKSSARISIACSNGLETRIVKGAVKAGTAKNCELQTPRRPNCRVDLHIHLDRLGTIIFFKDTTEQRRQARNASRASALMQASLNSLSAHVVVLDGTGAIVAANLAWQRFATV